MVGWDNVQSFVIVARLGSLTAAAAEMRLSVATLGRRIDALEQSLGIMLLRRGPAGTRLTEQGKALLGLAEAGAHHLDQLGRAAKAMQAGNAIVPVRISSTEPILTDILAPKTAQFVQRHPHIQLQLSASNEAVNLNVGDADIAIRLAAPSSDTLVARKLPAIALGLYCSPGYLAERSTDRVDLADEALLAYDNLYGDIPENRWITAYGLEHRVVMRSGSVRTLLRAAQHDAGIALLPEFLARRAGLVPIPLALGIKRQPWLVFHRDTRRAVHMQTVRRWIVAAFADRILGS